MPLARELVKVLAEKYGVCTRPLAIRRTDRDTGQTEILEVPCGARRASKCKPCANRNRRLRVAQITAGWHLAQEPSRPAATATGEVRAVMEYRATLLFEREALNYRDMDPDERHRQAVDLDDGIIEVDDWLADRRVRGTLPKPTPAGGGGEDQGDAPKPAKVTRSTKRRKDAGELPSLPITRRTLGRVYSGRGGRAYRPSMLLTPTLPSYGEVHTEVRTRRGALQPCTCGALHGERDDLLGTPIDPTAYDYRRAASDAIFFAPALDRWWQNIRRAAGYEVQYAGCVELQRRLAPHAHFAMRGTLPRSVLQQVTAATYRQIWWPPFDPDHQQYTTRRPPRWDSDANAYVDPDTRTPLATWADAVAALTDPAYVVRLGRLDARGIAEGSTDATRSVRYVTKYLTKDLADAAKIHSTPQQAHADRLHQELSVLPCSPTCANWLLYGVQPKNARPGLAPGHCRGQVHQPTTLGFTGRRVLISRKWSGKTLTDLREDNRAFVRALLAEAGQDPGPDTVAETGRGRYMFELARRDDPDVPAVQVRIMRAIGVRHQWREALRQARQHPSGLPGNVVQLSSTQDPHPLPAAA